MGRRERRQKKRKKRRTIISLVIVFLMIFGFTLAGIIVNNPNPGTGAGNTGDQSLEYNGIEFEAQNNYYTAEIAGKERKFLFLPTSTASINMDPEAIRALKNSLVITVTFDPDSSNVQNAELARFQLQRNLDKTIYPSVTRNSSQYTDSVVTCAQAGPNNPVVYLNASNKTSIDYNKGCVSVNGRQIDMLRATERLIYGMLGVIDDG